MRTKLATVALLAAISVLGTGCKEYKDIINVYGEDEGTEASYEKVITDYGAVGDGVTDCSDIINELITEMPPSGGVIVIPEGDFVLDKPITISRNYITLKGVNPGMRSNIDVSVDELLGPGGGSKLILRNASYGIHIPVINDVDGRKNRISGVEIKDVLISGGDSNKGTGIYVQQDNDRLRISNVIGINLNFGINVQSADAMIIRDCWISEVLNSIVLTNGIQNMISNCQLGAQPTGVTCRLVNEENLVFTGNHVYPNGSVNLLLSDCNYVNIAGNNFQSYFVGMLELSGNSNLVNGNIFWLRDSDNQLRSQTPDYGMIRIEGNGNQVSANTLKCDWNAAINNPVTVRSISGENNTFSNLNIGDQSSDQVFYVNETTRILDCVSAEKVKVDGNQDNVYIRY